MTEQEFRNEIHGLIEDLMFVARRYEEEGDSIKDSINSPRKLDMYSKSDGVMKAVQVIKERGWA